MCMSWRRSLTVLHNQATHTHTHTLVHTRQPPTNHLVITTAVPGIDVCVFGRIAAVFAAFFVLCSMVAGEAESPRVAPFPVGRHSSRNPHSGGRVVWLVGSTVRRGFLMVVRRIRMCRCRRSLIVLRIVFSWGLISRILFILI